MEEGELDLQDIYFNDSKGDFIIVVIDIILEELMYENEVEIQVSYVYRVKLDVLVVQEDDI